MASQNFQFLPSETCTPTENAKAKIAAGEDLEPSSEAAAEAAPDPAAPLEVVAEQEEEPVEEPVRVKGPAPSSKKARKKKRGH